MPRKHQSFATIESCTVNSTLEGPNLPGKQWLAADRRCFGDTRFNSMAMLCFAVSWVFVSQLSCNSQHVNTMKNRSYTSDFRLVENRLCLPLMIELGDSEAGTIYHHPVVGLRIESVVADGAKIVEAPLFTTWEDFDTSEMHIECKTHIYQLVLYFDNELNIYQLLTVSRLTADDFDVQGFAIPIGVNQLNVCYRPRFPEDRLGEIYTVIAKRNDSSPW